MRRHIETNANPALVIYLPLLEAAIENRKPPGGTAARLHDNLRNVGDERLTRGERKRLARKALIAAPLRPTPLRHVHPRTLRAGLEAALSPKVAA